MRGSGRPEYLTRKLTGRDGGRELGSGGKCEDGLRGVLAGGLWG